MANGRDEARRARAAARGERAQREDPVEGEPNGAQTIRETAKVAVTAAAVGAAVGAARALTKQRGDESETEQARPAEDGAAREPADAVQDEIEVDEGDRQLEQPRPAEPSVPPAPAPEDELEMRGVSVSTARRVVETAREQFELLCGRPAESVSSLERRPVGWRITLEVVELARIPESTDVLVTYEVTLDDDEKLVRYARGRRYFRSQAGEGGEL